MRARNPRVDAAERKRRRWQLRAVVTEGGRARDGAVDESLEILAREARNAAEPIKATSSHSRDYGSICTAPAMPKVTWFVQ